MTMKIKIGIGIIGCGERIRYLLKLFPKQEQTEGDLQPTYYLSA